MLDRNLLARLGTAIATDAETISVPAQDVRQLLEDAVLLEKRCGQMTRELADLKTQTVLSAARS